MVSVVAEVAVIDCDLGYGPIVAADNREVLCRCRNSEQHRCRAEGGDQGLAHVIGSYVAKASLLRNSGRRRQIGGSAGRCGVVSPKAIRPLL